MELGADKRSLLTLGGALVVLVGVLYFQFFLNPPASPPASPQPAAAAGTAAARAPGSGRTQQRSGRRGEGAPDPMSADITLRTDLLERVRGIEEPEVDRNIFLFGRPKPAAPAPPPPEVTEQAQRLLDAVQPNATAEPEPAPADAPPPKPPARPPNWKYYGLADDPSSEAARAFLLDGEEILMVREGTLVRGRYRITVIDGESISLRDQNAAADFTIQLEAAR